MNPTERAGELSVAVTGDLTALLAALEQAQGAADKAGAAIAAAMTGGEAASEASVKIESFGASAQHAGEGAHSAALNFESLVDGLKSVAGALGIELGLEELASEAVSASSKVEDLTTSLTFISGNAQLAGDQVEQLKQMSLTLGVSFEQVASSAQKMAPALGGFQQTVPLLTAAADVSHVLGMNFDGVANALDRMALSGNLMGRQLATLGIGIDDVAKALNTTDEEATKAFKALDVADRIEILTDALKKYAGASQAFADNLSTAWTRFKTQFTFDLEEAGKAVSPFLGNLLKIAEGIMDLAKLDPGVRTVGASFDFWNGVINHLKGLLGDTNEEQKKLLANLPTIASTTHATAQATAAWSKEIQDQIDKTRDAKDALALWQQVLLPQAQRLREQTGDTETYNRVVLEYQKVVAAASSATNELTKQRNEAIAAEDREQEAALKGLETFTQEEAKRLDAANSIALFQRNLQIANEVQAQSVDVATGAWANWIAKVTLAITDAAQIRDGITMIGPAFGEVDRIMAQAGLETHAQLQQESDDLYKLYQQLLEIQAAGGPVDTNDLDRITEKIYELNKSMGEYGETQDKTMRNGRDVVQQLNQTITRDLARSLADITFATGNIGQSFVNLGKQVYEIIVNQMIETALKPLLSMLSNVLSSVLNIGSAFGGSMAGATGSAAGSVAGGVGGSVGGALGGALGWAGLGVSIVSGIVSGIQGARTNDLLAEIEKSTRYAWISLGQGSESIAPLTKDIDNLLHGIEGFNYGVLHTDLVDIDSKLDVIVGSLRSMGSPTSSGTVLHAATVGVGTTVGGGNQPINVTINVNGAQRPEQIVRQISGYLRGISPKFSVV